jgi:hypothetical protein
MLDATARLPAGSPQHQLCLQAVLMQDRLTRLSLKMFNTAPDQLPDALREGVMSMISIPGGDTTFFIFIFFLGGGLRA